MTERTTFTRLRLEERVVISSMKLMGENTRAMARVFSRPASTVSRELSRNSFPALGYTSDSARCDARAAPVCRQAARQVRS